MSLMSFNKISSAPQERNVIYLMTSQALQTISELSLEVVHDETIVPRLPRSPLSFASNLRW